MNRKAVTPCFPFTYILILLLSVLAFLQGASAEEHSEDGDHFDGSEYNGSEFKDTRFEKEDYKELRSTKVGGPLAKGGDSVLMQEERQSSRKRRNENGVKPAGAGNEHGPIKKEGLAEQEKLPPVTDLPSDWVPDGINLTSNGGFTITPDNGSPVPYRLNGHVDIERGRP